MEGFLKDRGGLIDVVDKKLREAGKEPGLLISSKLCHPNRKRDTEPCHLG